MRAAMCACMLCAEEADYTVTSLTAPVETTFTPLNVQFIPKCVDGIIR